MEEYKNIKELFEVGRKRILCKKYEKNAIRSLRVAFFMLY